MLAKGGNWTHTDPGGEEVKILPARRPSLTEGPCTPCCAEGPL